MPIFELYSRRKKRAESAGEPDVYEYHILPETLRVQIHQILVDAIGPYRFDVDLYGNQIWQGIREVLCHEKGLHSLADNKDPKDDCLIYLASRDEIDDCLDFVELACAYINGPLAELDDHYRSRNEIRLSPKEVIEDLNYRFREARVGYQIESSKIIKLDSELTHAEVVKPALHFLSDSRFEGPREEFLAAHTHYRAGQNKEAVANALKAFESTMKTICGLKGWEYDKGSRASDLVRIICANGLLPDYLDKSFDQLINALKSGLPEVRNQAASHGQGPEPKETPGYVAGYALHLAAANILLLAEAFKASE